MKKIILFIGVLLFVFTMHAFRAADRKFADILSQLGVNHDEGKSAIFFSFFNSSFQYPTNKTIKSLTFPKRAEVAKELAAYTKKYLLSPEFRKYYQERLKAIKPESPEDRYNPERRMKEIADETRKEIKEYEQSIKEANDPKIKEILEKNLPAYKARLKSYTDPSDPSYASNKEPLKKSYEYEMKKYKDQSDQLNKDYPTDPNVMIKDRLQKFLKISATVDFDAELKEGYGGKKLFVKPEYERQSTEWKACYRAGKETIAVVRAEAEKFLKELE